MNLIRVAIERPVAVIAAVLMVVMFGLVALQTIPIQLAPDVNRPVISVRTFWAGAAPTEIERNIVNRQEEVLGGVENLVSISSRSSQGSASITLEFRIGTNMDRALLLVANRLDRVTDYPDEAHEPGLDTAGNEDTAIAWFMVTRQEGNDRPVHEFGDFLDDVVKERIERVEGVSKVNIYGESSQEIEIIVEPQRLARYGMTVSELVNALRRANASISAGDVEEGKRRYIVRTEGELDTVAKVEEVVIRSDSAGGSGRLARVTVADIATVRFNYTEPAARIRLLGQPGIALSAVRETGANVIETMKGVRAAIAELNEASIPNAGLKLEQAYDETVYINSSIELVRQNIWVGGALAALVLLLFLRSPRATLVISVAIPVSVVGSFVAMAALGRSINVISLAGLAFAVGMVVDAAIVVLENIYRLRETGKPAAYAAYHGAQQVWGAILVSALTTVMVFIPILVMELEVGQLFRDIAVAISVSVLLSLLVSVTVLPALSNRLLGGSDHRKEPEIKRLPLPGIDHFAAGFVAGVIGFTRFVVRTPVAAILVVAAITGAASTGAWLFLPKLEYLPEGNRNLVFGHATPPPGYNLKTTNEIAETVEAAVRPLWASETGPESEPGEPPKMERFFFVARRSSTFLGAIAVDPSRTKELIPILDRLAKQEPGTFAFVSQPSLFGRGIGGGRKIELDVSGPDLETILEVAQRAADKMTRILPGTQGNQFRPKPGLELGAPEIRVIPDRLRLADNGVTARELGDSVDTFNEGLRVVEITHGNKRINMMLRGPDKNVSETQGIGNLPVVTSSGRIIPVISLADVILTSGPTEIRHRENLRTVTLELRPSPLIPLETALEMIKSEVIDALRAEGLPAGIQLGISGTADKLSQTWSAMVLDLALALAIVYLVMAVLFESFVYPLIILLSVPVAAAGGVAGLVILNHYDASQSLDMLSLLGFVILIGIVVNNAILLVHQTLYHVREEGLEPQAAIIEATRNRIRPIFMSTLTSVCGMLPLVIFPGAGSELYRGLGSVVIGGLMLSALLTLLLIPPMLSMLVGPVERRHRKPASAAELAAGE